MKSKIIQMLDREVLLTYTSVVALAGGKKNEMVNRITKETKLKVLLIGNENTYKNIMLEADPYYIAKARQWGIRLCTGLIEHKDETYVEMIAKETLDVKYFLDGDLIDSSEITGLKESALRAIDFRCVKIANILSIDT
jgi:hypothetical protein